MGGGVCGAIFRGAGEKELQAACDFLSPIETGEAAITPGFKLPARYVIHAAGPVYDRHDLAKSEAQFRSAYLESLHLAEKNGCESIAFPLISSGIYGYPKAEALEVAKQAIEEFLDELAGETDLMALCIVSGVKLTVAPDGKGNGEQAQDCLVPCSIDVKLSEDPKCPRCWNHDAGIGADAGHPELCPRCAKVVKNG